MVESIKIVLGNTNTTNLNFGYKPQKNVQVKPSKYWKILFVFATIHAFVNMLRMADALPLSAETADLVRIRRHFPVLNQKEIPEGILSQPKINEISDNVQKGKINQISKCKILYKLNS